MSSRAVEYAEQQCDVDLRWTDAHCHLSDGPELDELLQAAHAAGVHRLITVGTDVGSSVAALALAEAHQQVWATAGVHPHEARHGVEGLERLAAGSDVVAIGECGLDYHYDHSPRDRQRDVFAQQVELAHGLGLPLVIHTRDAWADTFDILDAHGTPERTVVHCFTGGPDEARGCLDRGALLSISGIVTFPRAPEVRQAVALAPLDRLMVETDSPYLAPVPQRGRPNQPAWVTLVGSKVAEVKGVPLAAVAAATWDNAQRFYGLPDEPIGAR